MSTSMFLLNPQHAMILSLYEKSISHHDKFTMTKISFPIK